MALPSRARFAGRMFGVPGSKKLLRHAPGDVGIARLKRPEQRLHDLQSKRKQSQAGAVGNPDVRCRSELAKRRLFCGSRSIEWWWMQWGSNRSRLSNSRLSGKRIGNFVNSRGDLPVGCEKQPTVPRLSAKFPVKSKREFSDANREFQVKQTGNLIRAQCGRRGAYRERSAYGARSSIR